MEVEDLISEVISGKTNSVNLPYCTPTLVDEHLKGLDFERQDIETNGWDHDFWIPYIKGEETFEFSGSWFYGNYQFYKVEE